MKFGWIYIILISSLLATDSNHEVIQFLIPDPADCEETVLHPDYQFLKRFYEATNGDLWSNTLAGNKPWVTCNLCDWYGVVCENNRVVEINLPNNNVNGNFDIKATEFETLRKLDLSRNNFSFIASSGSASIPSLEYLDLSYTQLSNNYNNIFVNPVNLKYLDLSSNGLTYILPEIFNLPALEHLNLSQNNIGGSIPSQMANLNILEHIDFSSNDFTGTFPSYFSSLNRLKYLDLSDNRLYGCIPSSYNVHCDIQNNVFLDDNCTFDDPSFIEFCSGVVCDEHLILSGPSSSCYGQQITLSAEEGYAHYEWSGACGSSSSGSNNFITANCPGKYFVTITNSKGCTRSDSISISTYYEPDRFQSATFCEGGSVTVAGGTFSSEGTYQVQQRTGQGCTYTLYILVSEVLRPRNTYNLEICEGTSQSIHGQLYQSPGSFTQNVSNPSGCDSLLTVNVSILDTYTSEVYYSVCPGETAPHDGNSYGPGQSQRTYSAQNGCDSVLTIHVDELESFESNITLETCEGTTVTHDGIAYSVGNNSRTYTAQNGCDSVLYITVDELLGSSTFETHDICNGQTVNVLGQEYAGGTYDIPYLNTNDCASNLHLIVNETPPYIIRDTIVMCDGAQVQYDFYNYYNSPGSFTIDKTDAQGCNYTVELEIPEGERNREDMYLLRCDNEVITVNGKNIAGSLSVQAFTNVSGCDSFLWIHVDAQYSTTETIYQDYCFGDFPNINGTTYYQSGFHQQNFTNTVGCDSTLLIYLTRLDSSEEDLQAQICPNQEITINGKTYDQAGTFQQVLENTVGCDSFLNIEIIVKDTLKTNFYKKLCGDETVSVGGQTYSETGNDIQYYLTTSGCDSLVYIQIEKYDHTSEIINTQLCTGDPITYKDQEYSTGGTYTQNLINANGCDSTLTIIIDELSPSSSYNTRETCEGEPWSENGQSLSTAGNHIQVIPNAVGCDSTITINLIVHPHTAESMTLQVCRDDTRYVNEVPYNVAGSFEQNLTNAAGCDSTLTIFVEIVDEVRGNYREDLCEGGSTIINGEFFDETTTVEQNFISSIGCDSILTVTVVVHPATFGEVNTTVCSGSETFVNGISYIQGGEWTQVITNNAGCDSTITVHVEELLPTSSTAEFEICEGDPTIINGITYEYGGDFTQSFTNSVGCDSTYYISILEHPDTEHTLYKYICPGETVAVNNIPYTIPGIYEQAFTNSEGCDSTLFINVDYSSPKDTTLFDFICDEGEYIFKGSTYYTQGTYQFDTLTSRGCDSTIFLNLGLLTGSDTTIYRTVCKNEAYTFGSQELYSAGTYFDEIIIGGCKTPTTLILNVLEPVEGFRRVHRCEGDLFWINGKNESQAGIYQETIESSQGCDSILITELFFEPHKETIVDTAVCDGESVYFSNFVFTKPGNYRLKRKTQFGCDSIVKLNMAWYDNEIDVFNIEVCAGETAEFDGRQFPMGTHYGEYFDGNCMQDFELVVDETSLLKMNKTILLCEGDSVQYLGQNYTHSGQFYIGEAIGFCEFIEYVNVIPAAREGYLEEIFICEGTSIEIDDLIIDQAGKYTIDNCGTPKVFNVHLLNTDTIHLEHKINPSQSVNIEGRTFNQSGEYYLEVGSQANCSTILHLVIHVEACDGERTIYRSLCQGETYDFYGQAIGESGQYEHIKNLGISCDSTIKLDIQFSSIPDFQIDGKEILCSGDEEILQGPEGYKYLWNTGDTSRLISVNQSGEYELTIFHENGCTVSAFHQTNTISFPDDINIYQTAPSECGVEDGNIVLEMGEPYNYLFSNNGGIDWQESPVFDQLGVGTYKILLADRTLTCIQPEIHEVSLSNDGIPHIQNLIITQPNNCVGQKGSILVEIDSSSVALEFSIDGGISWSAENNFTNLEDGIYELLVSPVGSSCVNDLTSPIEIKNTAGLESEVIIEKPLSCKDASDATAKVNVLYGNGPFRYSWSNGTFDSIATSLSAGFHEVAIQDQNGCEQTVAFEIENIDLAVITSSFRDSIICLNDTLVYANLDSNYHYQLFLEDVFLAEGSQFQITETGHYQVLASNNEGCVAGTDFLIEKTTSQVFGSDFLLSSNGLVGEEIFVINISDPMPEKYNWEFDTSTVDVVVLDSLTQKLIFQDTGVYSIIYAVDNEGCITSIEKTIKIHGDSASIENESQIMNFGLEYWSVTPNPNDGNFAVEVNLAKADAIELLLFDMYGGRVGSIALEGQSFYLEHFKMPFLNTGVYSLALIHNKKIYHKKILIIN